MPLSLELRKVLLGVMKDLFTSLEEFKVFVRDSTGRNVDEIVVGNLMMSRSRVLDHAESREWLGELVEALKDVAGPVARATLDTIDLRASLTPAVAAPKRPPGAEQADKIVVARLGEGKLEPTWENLEKIVKGSNSLLEIGTWIGRATEIEGYVCRIAKETAQGLEAKGTGFLIGPSVVLTNHHVVADVLSGELDPRLLRAQFDHRVLRDGSVERGTVVGMDLTSAGSWKIDAAPHHAIDGKVHPIEQEPGATDLDYALLRLDTPVGSLPIAPGAGRAAVPKRGWLELAQHGAKARPSTPVFIVQHPAGLPMKLALDTEGAIGYSPNGLRMRYRTNTLRGSSGSPVFNENFEILALHHAGDPKYPELDSGEYNEGIPIPALLKQFKDRGLLEQLAQ